jgi:hypothetical protein
MTLPYLFSTIMLFLISTGKIKISKQYFGVLYIATMISVFYSTYDGFFRIPISLFNVRISTADIHGYALPMFWMPSADAVRGMFYHGSLSNLFVTYAGEWTLAIANWIYFYIVCILLFAGVVAILRRLWIEIEVLPFPHAQGWLIANSALQQTPSSSKFKKWLLIAFGLGILIQVPYWIYSIYPGFPDPYGWFTNPNFCAWSAGIFSLTDAYPAIMNTIAAPLTFSFEPLRYAFLFLVPLDGLLSMWIAQTIFVVLLPQLLSYFGFYSGIFSQGSWGKLSMIYTGPPLYVSYISAGMFLGVLVFLILINWKYFVELVKLAISGKAPEAGEISPRLGFGLLLLGGIGMFIEFVISNVMPFDAIIGLLIMLLFVIVNARLRAYVANVDTWEVDLGGPPFLKPFWGDTISPCPNAPAGRVFLSAFLTRFGGVAADTYGPSQAFMYGALDSFKVASMSGLKPKTVFKLLIIGAILSSLVVIPLAIIELHAFGFMEIPMTKDWDYLWMGDASYYNSKLSILNYWSLAGFILTGILLFLKLRFTWWPLEPLGFLIGLTALGPLWVLGAFTPFITWIVKYLVLKVGGRRAYEEIGVPIALGIITGEITGITVSGILLAIRVVIFKVPL